MNRKNNTNKLMNGSEVEWTELRTQCRIKVGEGTSDEFRSENPGEYPIINLSKVPRYFVSKWNTTNDPIGIVRSGAEYGSLTWYDGKYFRGRQNYSCTVMNRDLLLDRFLYYVLSAKEEEIRRMSNHQAIPTVHSERLGKIKIPVPPMSVQSRIVSMLDSYLSDLEPLIEALEGEKVTRLQEYEYYRNQLVSF